VAQANLSVVNMVVEAGEAGMLCMIVTDLRGRTIFSREIVVSVSTAGGNRVSLINGGNVISYACAPDCEQMGAVQGTPTGSAPPPAPAGQTITFSGTMPVPAPAPTAAPTVSSSITPGSM